MFYLLYASGHLQQTRKSGYPPSGPVLNVHGYIRWNPDDYSPDSDRKTPEEVTKRHKLVGDLIRDIQKDKHSLPQGLVSALYMYYDGWSSLAWRVLTCLES
jgi:hypothetical protein